MSPRVSSCQHSPWFVAKTYHAERIERYPRDKNVYHDHDNCPSGERIKRKHRESGPCKNRRLCDLCGILNRLDDAQHLVAELIKQMSV